MVVGPGGVLQGAISSSVLCSALVNDLDARLECTLSKFADDI